MRLGLLARGDVANRRGHQDSFRARQRTQHELDWKLASILASPVQFDPHADLLPQRVLGGPKAVSDQPFGKALRDDILHLLAQKFVAAVAELFLRLKIEKNDLAALVHHHHRVGRRL